MLRVSWVLPSRLTTKYITKEGDIMNPLYVGIDVSSTNNVAYIMKPDGDKHSCFPITNSRDGTRQLVKRILSAMNSLSLNDVSIGLEATSVYGENLVYFMREKMALLRLSLKSCLSLIQSRSVNSKMLIRICPRMTMWMPSLLPTILDSAELLRRSTWMTTATVPCKL